MKFVVIFLFTISVIVAQPITIHPDNPHYFTYKGKPTVLIGSGEHYGAVMNLGFDYNVYLQTMEKDGQSITRLFTGVYVEKLGAFGIKQNKIHWRRRAVNSCHPGRVATSPVISMAEDRTGIGRI